MSDKRYKQVSIMFDEQLYEAMEHVRKQEGVSRRQFVLKAVEKYIKGKIEDYEQNTAGGGLKEFLSELHRRW